MSDHGGPGLKRGRRLEAEVRRVDGPPEDRTFVLDIVVSSGWYVYPPGALDGVPLSVSCDPDAPVQVLNGRDLAEAGHLRGGFSIRLGLGTPDSVTLRLRTQACDGKVCELPETLRLVLPTRLPSR